MNGTGTLETDHIRPIIAHCTLYSAAGNYIVNLTVSSPYGTDSMLATIIVSAQPVKTLPIANFSSNVSDGYAPLSVQFTDLSENAANDYFCTKYGHFRRAE